MQFDTPYEVTAPKIRKTSIVLRHEQVLLEILCYNYSEIVHFYLEYCIIRALIFPGEELFLAFGITQSISSHTMYM